MTRKNFHIIAIFLFLSICTCSCVNLKQLNDYSSKSLIGIEKFENIDYSFRQHCLDACQLDAIKNFEIKRNAECNCNLYEAADSVTLLIYNVIKGYFTGLNNLSNNDLTTYDLGTLKKTLTEGDFGDIKIEKDQADAYASISNTLLRATTDLYRKKKIKQYIEDANQPIQILIEKLQFILQKNLEGELNYKKEKLYVYYKEMNLNGNITDYEKGKATIDYYRQLSDATQKQTLIEAFANGLQCISAGHQQLYDNRDRLTTKEIKELIKQYSSNLQDIVSEFNTLKK